MSEPLDSDEVGGNDEDEDEFIDLDADEFEDDEAEDVVTALGLGEDDEAPGISSGGTAWGEAGIKAAEKVSCQAGLWYAALTLSIGLSPISMSS